MLVGGGFVGIDDPLAFLVEAHFLTIFIDEREIHGRPLYAAGLRVRRKSPRGLVEALREVIDRSGASSLPRTLILNASPEGGAFLAMVRGFVLFFSFP